MIPYTTVWLWGHELQGGVLYLFRNLHVVFNVRVLLLEKRGNKTINCRGVVEEDVKPMSIEYRNIYPTKNDASL